MTAPLKSVVSILFYNQDNEGYPNQATPTLISFLQQKNVIATHFMIGSNILINPNQFLVAYNAGHDISQHTHSHPYMTTLQNLQIVGEVRFFVPPVLTQENQLKSITIY